ncbi:MAG: hypothetical protein C4551_03020 [Bacillota bacterium]|nr:MAG: hypothetical protein C4551_03020 [Bacillota bacterium]
MSGAKPGLQPHPKSEDRPHSIPYEEAVRQVHIVASRLALLHLCFARTLTEKLGKEQGTQLVLESIRRYGEEIGREVRAKVEEQHLDLTPENYGAGPARDLPSFGLHDGVEHVEQDGQTLTRAYGCHLAKVWRERGQDDLGRLYCYVDPAKYMAFNPEFKMVHLKCVPSGDPLCEFRLCPTTAEERRLFQTGDPDWVKSDKP